MFEDFARYELITKGPPHLLAGYFIYGRWARGRTLAKLIRLHFTKKQEIIWDGRRNENLARDQTQTRVSAVLIYINSLLPAPPRAVPPFALLRTPTTAFGFGRSRERPIRSKKLQQCRTIRGRKEVGGRRRGRSRY